MHSIDKNELRPAPSDLCEMITHEVQLRGQDLPQWIAVYVLGGGSVALHAGRFILDLGEAHELREALERELVIERAKLTRAALLVDLEGSKCLIAPIELAMATVVKGDLDDRFLSGGNLQVE